MIVEQSIGATAQLPTYLSAGWSWVSGGLAPPDVAGVFAARHAPVAVATARTTFLPFPYTFPHTFGTSGTVKEARHG